MNATGQCLCGAVRFTAESVHTDVHACHCGMCRRWGGGPAFATSVGAVVFEGEQHISRFNSSEWAERGFCKRCGTNLFYRLKDSNQHVLWMGAFDDPAPFRVAGEIFIDEKPEGYALAGEHPRLTGEQFLKSIQSGSGD